MQKKRWEMQDYKNHPLAGARDIDTAMNLLWSFYKKHFVVLYLLSLVVTLITSILTSTMDLAVAFEPSADPGEVMNNLKTLIGPYSVILLMSMVTQILLHASVLVLPMEGGSKALKILRTSAVVLVPYLLAVLILGFCGGIITALGFILLILPGLFAMFYFITVGLFALPVTLVERPNPFTVFTRSFELAHKNLWPNMGWVSVCIILIMVFSIVIGALTMLPFTGSFFGSFTNPENSAMALEMTKNPFYIGLSSVMSALVTPVYSIISFILYFRNRDEDSLTSEKAEDERRVRVEDLYPKMPDRE